MSYSNKNIVLVDDHQIIIDGIKSMLASTEFNIIKVANNGQEAFEYLTYNYHETHLVLTDVSMPIMDGIELCQKIKSQYHHIGVLMLSMYNSVDIVKKAIEAEADGYILKNSGKEEMEAAIKKILDGGTYFSQDIIPLLYGSYIKEKQQTVELSLLSVREIEILKLIVKEYTSEEIAQQLFISKKTVDNHRTNLLEKTSCKTTVGLVKFAIRNQLEK
jgi:two-component system, NarL family, nitrate/nitrite response regulator NarL